MSFLQLKLKKYYTFINTRYTIKYKKYYKQKNFSYKDYFYKTQESKICIYHFSL